ncbi:hypothetical protein [Streptomyces spongiae]|uniref:Uncharacterized protein n=1 Tax=Streptomyces spongiae TaxID=565072 RepID=A0A5N8XI92_9ACTN|nr:hypothetical protein [Streptomyces spongiae]MPY59169.1 hypothetical protein [Streptomyces spongiae]
MVTGAALEITQALDHLDPRRAVDRVKDVVQRRLQGAYPRARIVRTDYFNHSYVPDLVMEWGSGNQAEARPVYLRASVNPDILAAGVSLMSPKSLPLIIPLEDFPAGEELGRLVHVAETEALVLAPSGLGELPSQAPWRSTATLASDALVEGGHGVMDGSAVRRFLADVDEGVSGARAGNRISTRKAVDSVEHSIVPAVGQRMTTFLAALWQGGGRSLLEFPGGVPRRTSLDAVSLGLLLNSEEIPEESFWQRVSPLTDLRTLLASGVSASANLQHFMRSTVHRWTGHVCMVVSDEHAGVSDRATHPWQWSVRDGRLGLHVPGQVAYVGDSRRDLQMPEEYPVPLLDEVRARASRFRTPVTGFRMITANRTIGYDGTGEDVTHDPQLQGISDALGREEGVVEATALCGDGVKLRCSFIHRTVSPPGARTKVPYAELVGTALSLLTELGDEGAHKLEILLGGRSGSDEHWSQPDLFEE